MQSKIQKLRISKTGNMEIYEIWKCWKYMKLKDLDFFNLEIFESGKTKIL